MGTSIMIVLMLVIAAGLTYITRLRRENRTLRKTVQYQKQIIDKK